MGINWHDVPEEAERLAEEREELDELSSQAFSLKEDIEGFKKYYGDSFAYDYAGILEDMLTDIKQRQDELDEEIWQIVRRANKYRPSLTDFD